MLIGTIRHRNAFQFLTAHRHLHGLAYAAVVDVSGNALAHLEGTELDLPTDPIPSADSMLVGDRLVGGSAGELEIREFFAPVLERGHLVGHIRVGVTENISGASTHPFSWLLGLLVTVPLLLWYAARQRGRASMSKLKAEADRMTESGQIGSLSAPPSGDAVQLVAGLNRLLQGANSRIQSLQGEKTQALASSTLLVYEKSQIEAMLESLPDATLVVDRTGTVSICNAKIEGIWGLRRENIVGRGIEEWCTHPEVGPFLERYCRAVGRHSRPQSMTVQLGGSGDRHICVTAQPLVDAAEGAESAGSVVNFRDVTGEVVARRAQEEFVSHVAHEIKAPLHLLTLYGDMLADEKELSEEQRIEACNVITEQVECLAELVNTLLALAKLETGQIDLERQQVRLAEFLREMLDSVSRSRMSSGLRFDLKLPARLSPVSVDKDLFRVALKNFLTNAVKYNREGGSLTLSAEESTDTLVIRVADTGIGISREDQHRIFDKFFRSEADEVQRIAGHGLGMALARQIVELHGGRVEVQSELGEGSQFILSFKRSMITPEEGAP